ncbi:unnamed protein product, partial [Closterium sp. Naga37s-1]
YAHPQWLEGQRGEERLYERKLSDSLLHTSVWESRETEVAGEGVVGERTGDWSGGDGGLEDMVRSSSWCVGAQVSGVENKEESLRGGVGLGEAAARVEPTSADVATAGVGVAAAGVAMEARGGGGGGGGGEDMMTSVHGMELEELESLLLDVDEDMGINKEGVAATMPAYPTANAAGSSHSMWSKGHETLLLPESFFPAPAVVGTGGWARTDGAAAAAAAEAATTGTTINVAGMSVMGDWGLSSAQRTGKMLSPKRSREED